MIRIEYLKLEKHPQLGDIELFFTENNEVDKVIETYNTVIIGPNGTGKSYILSTIINLFRELNDLKEKGKRKIKYNIGDYKLEYSLNGSRYCYRNIKIKGNWGEFVVQRGKRRKEKPFYIEKNGQEISFDEIQIPEAILASSITLTDKFVFLPKPDEFPNYKYLGIRGSRSTAGTRTYIKNTINYLAHSSEKNIFIETLPKILDFLELDKYLFLSYSVKRKDTFFHDSVSKDTFANFIKKYETELEQRRQNSVKNIIPWYAFSHYKNILNDEILLDRLIAFCRRKSKILEKNDNSGNYYFEYDLLNGLNTLEEEITFINLLEKLNLIGYPELCIKKVESPAYSYEGASSGESHFVSSIIGILSTIKQNSIVLIDEPEISLHPNWQMKYMSFLREVFDKFTNCHFIIATHSHFLISDLKGENSKIIGLNRENNRIVKVKLPEKLDTFGWSAEEVLYSVFNVRSSRNAFLELDLTKMVSLINKNSEDFDEIRRILIKISKLVLSDNDPLNILKEKAEIYLNKNNA